MKRYGLQGKKIIKAAHTVLSDHPHDFSIELLCHVTGFDSKTVYRFFPGEIELVLAAYNSEMIDFECTLEATIVLSRNTALQELSVLYAQFLAARPTLCRALLSANERAPGSQAFLERLVQSATLVALVHTPMNGLSSDMKERFVRDTIKYLMGWICHSTPPCDPEDATTRLFHYLSM